MSDRWKMVPVGTRVRCANPDDFFVDTARKLRNREGVVVNHQCFSGSPIIEFPAIGRRKPFVWVASFPSWIELTGEPHP